MNSAMKMFTSLRHSDVLFAGYVTILVIAAGVAEIMGDFNTWVCLTLAGFMMLCTCFVAVDCDPASREVNGQRYLNYTKFFVKAAFLSALLALLRSYSGIYQ